MRKFLLLLFLPCLVSGYTCTFQVWDINTQNLIDNVSILFYNGTEKHLGYTNSMGLASMECKDDSFLILQKIGYQTSVNESLGNISSDNAFLRYMYPISTNGIIRVKIKDNTLNGGHKFCFFYAENDRLSGCYGENDTITLIVDHNYIIMPQIEKGDIINSPQAMGEGISYYYHYLWPFLLVMASLLLIIMVISHAFKK
jgi:hypothetical protein